MIAPNDGLRRAVRDHLVEQVSRTPVGAPAPRGLRPASWPRALALGVVVAVLAGAGAIAASVSGARSAHPAPAAPSPSVSASPTDAPDPVLLAQTRVVGTGTFDGPLRGRFTIRYDALTSRLHLVATTLGPSSARAVELATSADAVGCTAPGIAVYFGSITGARTQDVVLAEDAPAPAFGDLSLWSTIAILPAEAADDQCDRSLYTIAAIHWYLPPQIAELADRDRGARAAASGPVTIAHGRPVRYTVADDDQIEEVAARFGLTEDDLLYLNRNRRHGDDIELYAGEVLNLDPADRAYFSP